VISPTGKPGLQTERTQLAWERTAIGFLTVGALVLLRHDELPFPERSVVATMAFALTIVVVLVGKLRSFNVLASRGGIFSVGCATVGLATTAGVLIALVQT
jgi:uncharacterized membrane protein YidH (DUF202 family)